MAQQQRQAWLWAHGALCAGLFAVGCGPRLQTPRGAEDAVVQYVAENRQGLERAAVLGSGSEVLALGRRAGCQDIGELARRLRRNQTMFGLPVNATDGIDRAAGALPAPPSPAGGYGVNAGLTALAPPDDATVGKRIVKMMKKHRELRCLDLEWGPGSVYSAGRRRVYGVDGGMGPRPVLRLGSTNR
jgi:hypothetical protein